MCECKCCKRQFIQYCLFMCGYMCELKCNACVHFRLQFYLYIVLQVRVRACTRERERVISIFFIDYSMRISCSYNITVQVRF